MFELLGKCEEGANLTAAEGERRRWRPRIDFGGGAGSILKYFCYLLNNNQE